MAKPLQVVDWTGQRCCRLLSEYNYQILQRGAFTRQREIYSFYLGLVFYYRGNSAMAGRYLEWSIHLGTQDDYIQAVESLLKKTVTSMKMKTVCHQMDRIGDNTYEKTHSKHTSWTFYLADTHCFVSECGYPESNHVSDQLQLLFLLPRF